MHVHCMESFAFFYEHIEEAKTFRQVIYLNSPYFHLLTVRIEFFPTFFIQTIFYQFYLIRSNVVNEKKNGPINLNGVKIESK